MKFHIIQIFFYSVPLRIQSECGKMRGNADQNNSEYGRFLRRVYFLFSQYSILISDRSHMTSAKVFPKTRSLLPLSENARIFLTPSPPEVRYNLCIY